MALSSLDCHHCIGIVELYHAMRIALSHLHMDVQVKLQCHDRGNLLADLWTGMQTLVHLSVADAKAARIELASCAASTEALQAAMPVLLSAHSK